MSSINFLRYPGSKTKLLPPIMDNMNPILIDAGSYADVFVGGGSVLLEVAEKYPNHQLLCNDKDPMIHYLWSIVSGNDSDKFEELINLIQNNIPTVSLFNQLRSAKPTNDIEYAYRAVFFNRCCFSGMLHAGPIGGKNQTSKYKIDCRYNAVKIVEKMRQCRSLLLGRLQVSNVDVIDYLNSLPKEIPLYLDPPYVKAGKQLYPVFMEEVEHKNMAEILLSRNGWVLSYDDDPFVKSLYYGNTIIDLAANYCINGKKTSWQAKNELLILG